MVKKKKKGKEIAKKIVSGYSKLGKGVLKIGKYGVKEYRYRQSPEYKKKMIEQYKLETKLLEAKRKMLKERKTLQPQMGDLGEVFGY